MTRRYQLVYYCMGHHYATTSFVRVCYYMALYIVDRCHSRYTVVIQTLTMTRCPITSYDSLRNNTACFSMPNQMLPQYIELTPCVHLYVHRDDSEIQCVWSMQSSNHACDSTYILSPTAVVCPSLSNPANGIVDLSQGTSLNAVATYSCNVGYRLEGTGQRTCDPEGGWSDTQPVCEGNLWHSVMLYMRLDS